MKERPILFTDEMVRAILDARKTQTRRVVKPMQGEQRKWLDHERLQRVPSVKMGYIHGTNDYGVALEHPGGGPGGWIRSPYGHPGDRLWVRETHRYWFPTDDDDQPVDDMFHVRYRSDDKEVTLMDVNWDEGSNYSSPFDVGLDAEPSKWRSPYHMFRWASRLMLEVVSVRVERVQEIGEDDAKAEGVRQAYFPNDHFREYPSYVAEFPQIWDPINDKRGYGWDANPWVWVVEFRRVEQ